MTGPSYPRPIPGSNSIGSFVIGVSPIGTIAPFDFWPTVISQYANSPVLTSILQTFYDAVDQTINFENFFDDVWNLDTAIGHGLDVWGRIVGVSRTIQIAPADYLGFEESMAGPVEAFGQAPFYSGSTVTNNYDLSDDSFRTLINAKALSNICDGSIAGINAVLLTLFPNRGNCYVVDNGDMTITYTFAFSLSAVELAILGQSSVLPTPTGVSATILSP